MSAIRTGPWPCSSVLWCSGVLPHLAVTITAFSKSWQCAIPCLGRSSRPAADPGRGDAESPMQISCPTRRRSWGESYSRFGTTLVKLTPCQSTIPRQARPPATEPVRRRTWRWPRSLDSARLRSEGRVQRFLDAGFELLCQAESGKEFTVQEVVDRSGQSLRSFYQYFAGKHELLLALFDEAIRSTADRLEEQIARAEHAPRAAALLRRRVLPHVPARTRRAGVEEQPHAGDGRVLPPVADRPPDRGLPGLRPPRDAAREGARRGRRGRGHPRPASTTPRSPA